MTSALIIYGSTTGNTEFTAEEIETALKESNVDITLKNVTDAGVEELEKEFDLYLLGASTWGEDEIELQEDFVDFFDDMKDAPSFEGKRFAVFGCGDSSYDYFCGAVDAIEERVKAKGGTLVAEGLKIDGDPETDEIKEWTESVVSTI
ncbi:MAG: flavodoxin [Desulfobacteraceae bacterium]|nr:flavodoxin [Desulfobacteraceae bacterium]